LHKLNNINSLRVSNVILHKGYVECNLAINESILKREHGK